VHVLTFAQPLLLTLLLLIPLSIWIAWPRLITRTRAWSDVKGRAARVGVNRRALIALLIRCALIAAVALALAGMQAVRFSDRSAVVFLIDGSDSVGANGREQAADWVRNALAAMRTDGNDSAAVVVFGADAQIERTLSLQRELAPLGAQVRSGGTNIENAIRLGLSILPADASKRIVLLSDGRQTSGDADGAARLARAAGARLDTVALASVQGPDAAVERIDTPQRASIGQTIPLQIVVRSNTAGRAQLSVFSGSDLVSQQTVNLVVGQNEFSVRAQATAAGFSAFRAQIAAESDVRPQNNILSASVAVGGPPRVLLVTSGASGVDEAGPLLAALDAADIDVVETTARAMPSEIQSLAGYQSVILANVPARELSQRTMLSLQSYVRDIGGGLVVIGGPNSYGVGGYFKTPLEETLPVDMQVKDPKRFPSVSIVIVMDKSGSMSVPENGVLKMRLAAEAAARVAELVNDEDEVTVIGFDTDPVDVIGPFPGRDRQQYLQQILSIAPGGGGIYVRESLEEARKITSQSQKRSKFIILLADGSDSENQDGVREMVRQMNEQENTTLTVVSIGDGSDVPFLKNIASVGKGRFHLTDKASTLPTIFTEEAALAQRSYIVEQPFLPRQGAGSPILNGITEVPQLLGYIASTPKPSAQVILRANESDPLLATWQFGLGRAVAFTSDATGRWGQQWVPWSNFARFWAQAVRWTILERGESQIQASVVPRGDRSVIVAEVPDERASADMRVTANVIDATGQTQAVTLTQVAPGRFEAEAGIDQPGAYFVRVRPVVTATASGTALGEATLPFVKPYSAEYVQTAGGEDSLRAWADLGGGALLTEPAAAFDRSIPLAASRTELFPWLLALAALLLPFDIAARRIGFNLRKLLGRAAMLAPAAAGAPAQTVAPATPTGSRPTVTVQPSRSAAAGAGPAAVPPRTPPRAGPIGQTPGAAGTPAAVGSTASELLKRKRKQQDVT
jgi:uncharacterized membrane protein